MRQEFSDRLKILNRERVMGSWKDGWVYGRLKQEFDLHPDELNAMATILGFKYGWNPMVKDILDNQWQEDEVRWMQQEANKIQKQASLNLQKAKIKRQAFLDRQKNTLSQKTATLLQEIETAAKSKQELTEIERALIALIITMNADEQWWVLDTIHNRRKEKTLLDGGQM